jgi:membrane fusion protein (multidrug efflux system)
MAATTNPNEDGAPAREAASHRRRFWFLLLGAAVAVAALIWFLYWLLVSSHYVATDNAYVGAEVAQVTPLVSGAVAEVRVRETEGVKAGQVLVVVDPSDARLALAAAQAELGRAVRQVQQASETGRSLAAEVQASGAALGATDARIAKARADLERSASDLRHRQALAGTGAVAGEELTSARNSWQSARAALAEAEATRAQALASRSAASGTRQANEVLTRGPIGENPEVAVARAKVDQARLDLARTVIRAPIAGVIARRAVQVGQRVAIGAPLMSIVPVDQAYVDANFKEVQLDRVRIGQKVTLTSDLYGGDIVYHGRVTGFAGGTGSAFALIPAQNATGNWIKIVQRLPVRVALDPAELRAHPLRVGLSMKASIDLRDR